MDEDAIRKAAAWPDFKAGRALWESGMVREAKRLADGWSGVVLSGGKPRALRVLVRSPREIETRCGCPENRRSGIFCSHAVAVGLALARPDAGAVGKAPVQRPERANAYGVEFSKGWRDRLGKGSVALTIRIVDGDATAADSLISIWLAAQQVTVRGTVPLVLGGELLASLMGCLIGHPRVTEAGTGEPLAVAEGGVIPIASLNPEGEVVRIHAAPGLGRLVRLGVALWRVDAEGWTRIGKGDPPKVAAALISSCIREGAGLCGIDDLLGSLDLLQEWFAFPDEGWLASLRFVPAPLRFRFDCDAVGGVLRLKVFAGYPGEELVPGGGGAATLPRLEGDRCLVRDVSAEERLCADLREEGFEDGGGGCWSMRDSARLAVFCAKGWREFARRGDWREGPGFRSFRGRFRLVSPVIRIRGESGEAMEFDLEFKDDAGELVSDADMRRLLGMGRKGSQRSGSGILTMADPDWEEIEPLWSELDIARAGGHLIARGPSAEVIRLLCARFGGSVEAPNTPAFVLPASFRAELRPYQADGVRWIGERTRAFGGALLADDMGLGKTVQAIGWIEQIFAGDGGAVVLVVATATLLGNWRAELARFAPERRVVVMHGADRESRRETAGPGTIVITSYSTLARDLAWHLGRGYAAVVADEASVIRNPDTDHAKALCRLGVPRRLALTGTPLENSVRDLWSLFRFLQPGWLGSRKEFEQRYKAEEGGADPASLARLRMKVAPFFLRRTKEQVAADLPGKVMIDEYCGLSPLQRDIHARLLEEARRGVAALDASESSARMIVLTALLRLRQACCDPALLDGERYGPMPAAERSGKCARLTELLDEALAGGHRVLVFSQFKAQLDGIGTMLGERGIAYLQLDGTSRDRPSLVESFQAEDGPPVFLISLKAGGYGLNLTRADIVIHFDPWWNPAAEAQATDRAHRIGQTRPVTVYRLLTRGTVEERVLALQERKRGLASVFGDGDTGDPPSLGLTELKGLLDAAL